MKVEKFANYIKKLFNVKKIGFAPDHITVYIVSGSFIITNTIPNKSIERDSTGCMLQLLENCKQEILARYNYELTLESWNAGGV